MSERIDCARCGLQVGGNRRDELLCMGCHTAWVNAGSPDDELPPLSEAERLQIAKFVDGLGKFRTATRRLPKTQMINLLDRP